MKTTSKKTIVLCITGSSCCFEKLKPIVEELVKTYNITTVMSEQASAPNRFCNMLDFSAYMRDITGNNIITSIAGSETLSAKKDIVASLVLPATGNTVAKLACAITDTPVTMAVKALLRNSIPCVIGLSTNDALSGQAENIGKLLSRKNYYFIPFAQDDPKAKPFSCVCDFSKTHDTIKMALKGEQLQPILI